jgi:hypothetical protein
MYISLNAKHLLLSSDFSKNLHFPNGFFEKYPNFKIHENPSSGTRVFPCGQTNRQTDMTKIIFVFRNFAKGPNKTKGKKHSN